jgi:pimeloyl-ACP methyl ester carboxylesterase
VRKLAREGYSVWRLDIAGFGLSEEVEDGFLPDSDYAAQDIAAAVDFISSETGEEKIDLLGWSWGTVTVSRFVSDHSGHVNKLVLYAPILNGIGEYEVQEPFHHNTWDHAADDFQRTDDGSFDDSITDPVVREMWCSSCWHYDGEHSPNGGRRDACVSTEKKLIEAYREAPAELKKAALMYSDLAGEPLIRLLDSYPAEDMFVCVFAWADGECLFDHWNFEYYKAHPEVRTPMERFKALPAGEKISAADEILRFLMRTAQKGYTAVDFYDGSLLYDFAKHRLTVCDIDLFEKGPLVNQAGEGYPGTKRLKAPEENQKGAVIDEKTNVFTAGALIMDLFSRQVPKQERYRKGGFIPAPPEAFMLPGKVYEVLKRAADEDRDQRFETIRSFFEAWNEAVRGQ